MDIPVLMSAPMVLACLREIAAPGTGKTMTRRILKPQPEDARDKDGNALPIGLLHVEGDRRPRVTIGRVLTKQEIRWAVGDRRWVREGLTRSGALIHYAAGGRVSGSPLWPADWKQDPRPSIHMPRWASRITLIVTGLKIERLQDISDADCFAEGAEMSGYTDFGGAPMIRIGEAHIYATPRAWFRELWGSINGPGAWDENPWVVGILFRPVLANIDAVEAQAA